MKKLLAVILLLALCATMLTGCVIRKKNVDGEVPATEEESSSILDWFGFGVRESKSFETVEPATEDFATATTTID